MEHESRSLVIVGLKSRNKEPGNESNQFFFLGYPGNHHRRPHHWDPGIPVASRTISQFRFGELARRNRTLWGTGRDPGHTLLSFYRVYNEKTNLVEKED